MHAIFSALWNDALSLLASTRGSISLQTWKVAAKLRCTIGVYDFDLKQKVEFFFECRAVLILLSTHYDAI